jgi:hypothetical protein
MLVQFVQQPRTEKRTGNVVSAQKGNATTTVIQFKQRAAIARNIIQTNLVHIPVLNYVLLF